MNRDFNRFVSETRSRLPPVPRSTGVGGIMAGDVPSRVKKEQEQQGSSDEPKTPYQVRIYWHYSWSGTGWRPAAALTRLRSSDTTNLDAPVANFPPQLNMTNTPMSAGIGQGMCSRAATKYKNNKCPPTNPKTQYHVRMYWHYSWSGTGWRPAAALTRLRSSDTRNLDAPAENFPPELNMTNTPTSAGIGQAMCSRAATKNKNSQDPPTL